MPPTIMSAIDSDLLKYNYNQEKSIHHGMPILELKDNTKAKLEPKPIKTELKSKQSMVHLQKSQEDSATKKILKTAIQESTFQGSL